MNLILVFIEIQKYKIHHRVSQSSVEFSSYLTLRNSVILCGEGIKKSCSGFPKQLLKYYFNKLLVN